MEKVYSYIISDGPSLTYFYTFYRDGEKFKKKTVKRTYFDSEKTIVEVTKEEVEKELVDYKIKLMKEYEEQLSEINEFLED